MQLSCCVLTMGAGETLSRRKEGLGILRGVGIQGRVIFSLLGLGGSLLHSQNPGIVRPSSPYTLASSPQLTFYFDLHTGRGQSASMSHASMHWELIDLPESQEESIPPLWRGLAAALAGTQFPGA